MHAPSPHPRSAHLHPPPQKHVAAATLMHADNWVWIRHGLLARAAAGGKLRAARAGCQHHQAAQGDAGVVGMPAWGACGRVCVCLHLHKLACVCVCCACVSACACACECVCAPMRVGAWVGVLRVGVRV